MSLVETIRQWDEGVVAADKKDWPAAFQIFCEIQEPNSKIYFNICCLCLINGDLNATEKVLHNVALAHAQLNEWEKAEENLLKALNLKTEAKHSHIDRALGSILKQKLFDLVELPMGELFRPNKHHVAQLEKKDYLGKAKKQKLFDLVELPMGELFRPNKHHVAQLEKKDYLGKAKVLASVIHQDAFSGFAPLQPQKGLVPYNYLEPVELTLSSKKGQETNQSEDLPKPPKDEPPERPAVLETSMLNAKDTEESSAKETNQSEDLPKPPKDEPPERPAGPKCSINNEDYQFIVDTEQELSSHNK
ncbi:UNVERIFIED_CONTAM: hypothetical protein FKN15_026730 [Acipenser sinensis]